MTPINPETTVRDAKDKLQEAAKNAAEVLTQPNIEQILQTLEKKLASATEDGERKRYEELIRGLKGKLEEKKAGIQIHSADDLEKLLKEIQPTSSISAQEIYDSAAGKVSEGIEAGKNAIIKLADIKDASTLMAQAGNIFKEHGVFGGAWEILKKGLQLIWEFLFGGAAVGGAAVGGAIAGAGAIGSGNSGKPGKKDEGENGKPQESTNEGTKPLSPEKIQEAKEKYLSKMSKYIQEDILKNVPLSEEKLKKLREILEKQEIPQKKLQEILEKKEATVGDAKDLFFDLGLGTSKLVLDLVLVGVIPASRIGMYLVEGSVKTGAKQIALTLDGIGLDLAPFGLEAFEEEVKSLRDDPQKKALMMHLLYKPAGFLTNIIGTAVGGGLNLAIGLTTNTTVDSLFKMAPAVLTNDFTKLSTYFAALENDLQIPRHLQKSEELNALLRTLTQRTGKISQNYLLLEFLRNSKDSPTIGSDFQESLKKSISNLEQEAKTGGESAKNALNRAKVLLQSYQTELGSLKSSNFEDVRGFVQRQISIPSESFDLRSLQEMLGGSHGQIQEHLDRLTAVETSQARLANNGGGLRKYWEKFDELKKISPISRVQDVTMMHMRPDDLKRSLTALSKLGAEGIRHAFNTVPIIGLAMSTEELLRNPNAQKDLGSIVELIGGALSLPYASYVLLKDSGYNFENHEVVNPVQGALGMAMITATGVQMLRIGADFKGQVQFLTGISTAKDIGRTLTATIRGARHIRAITPTLLERMAILQKKPGALGKTGAALAAIAVIAVGISAYHKMTEEKEIEELAKKDGYMKYGLPTDKFYAELQNYTLEKKREIVDSLFAYSNANLADLKVHFDGQNYIVLAKKGQDIEWVRKEIEKTGIIDTFSKLGIQIDCTQEEEIAAKA